ncbi:MAG: hypothetical protein HPY67_02065 [Syntrophaceae bacterium]|nr:hypothetical protein [Syntrophaceae bacterium]
MKGYATKLIEVTEKHADRIASQWLGDVRMNPKTPSYHNFSDEKALSHAAAFYRNFRSLFSAEKPYDAARKFFTKYADGRYAEGIPLHEAIYALILMRRHIWLYAEFQSLFVSAVEHQQAAESLTRTILMFDYATYVITERYEELMKRETEERIRREGRPGGRQQPAGERPK